MAVRGGERVEYHNFQAAEGLFLPMIHLIFAQQSCVQGSWFDRDSSSNPQRCNEDSGQPDDNPPPSFVLPRRKFTNPAAFSWPPHNDMFGSCPSDCLIRRGVD